MAVSLRWRVVRLALLGQGSACEKKSRTRGKVSEGGFQEPMAGIIKKMHFGVGQIALVAHANSSGT